MAACEWILYNNEVMGEYRAIPLGSAGCAQMHHKTLKHCSFYGTMREVREELRKREYADGLMFRGGVRAAIGNPSYHKKEVS